MSGVDSLARAARRLRRLPRGLLRRTANRYHELRYGVETDDNIYLDDLGLETRDRVWHHPSDWVAVRRALERLEVGRDDVFVDYGSGLGRAVIVASTFPFRRVIGVELSAEMTDRARRYVDATTSRRRAGEVELVVAEALDWEVPPDLTVAYLYCPFTAEVFDGVVERLVASIDSSPRPMRLIYNYPVEHSRLLRTGRVRVLDVASARWPPGPLDTSEVIVTYLLLPGDRELRDEYERKYPQRLGADARAWLGEYEPGYELKKPDRLGGMMLERPPR